MAGGGGAGAPNADVSPEAASMEAQPRLQPSALDSFRTFEGGEQVAPGQHGVDVLQGLACIGQHV